MSYPDAAVGGRPEPNPGGDSLLEGMFTTWTMCRSVTADEIQAFARRYPVRGKRVVVELLAPTPSGEK